MTAYDNLANVTDLEHSVVSNKGLFLLSLTASGFALAQGYCP